MLPFLPYSMLTQPHTPFLALRHALASSAPSPCSLPAPGRYQLDPDRSTVRFTVRGLGIPVRGRFSGVVGRVRVGRPAADVTVTAEIDVASLRTGIRKRDHDLLRAGFFDAAAHPTIRFTADRLDADGPGWTVAGRLAVRGTERPVRVHVVDIRRIADGCVVVQATAEVDRRAFGIGALRLVGPRVAVDIELTAAPEQR